MLRSYDDSWTVDGLPMLSPDEGVENTQNDLDAEDSGRDESGYLHRIVIREKVNTWGFTYKVLTSEEYSYLMSLFAGKSTFIFGYLDMDGQIKECEAYCSKNSITIHNPRTDIYKNLKFNIIEC